MRIWNLQGLYTSRSESEDVKQYVSGVIIVLRKSEIMQ